MKAEVLKAAIDLGMTTQEELKSFELGYLSGQYATMERVIEVNEAIVPEFQANTIPDFLQDGFEPSSITMHTNRDK